MNTFKYESPRFRKNSLNVDEVVPWEEKNISKLVDAVLAEAVSGEVGKARTERCCGCEVNHRCQGHECLMMTKEEGWIMHRLQVIERNIERQIVWKQFTEKFNKELNNMKFNSGSSESPNILAYLYYWSENQ